MSCALLTNLAVELKNAELIGGQDLAGCKLLLEKAFSEKSQMLMAILRQLSSHDGKLMEFFAVNLLENHNLVFDIHYRNLCV